MADYSRTATIDEPSFSRISLNGKHLRVIWPNWVGNPKGLVGPLKGQEILNYLTGRFQFTYEFVRVTEDWLEPNEQTRGQFTYLLNKEVDLLMNTVQPTSERHRNFDLTSGYSFVQFSILIPVSDVVSSNAAAILKPFNWLVWTLLLVSAISVAFVLKLIQLRLMRSDLVTARLSMTNYLKNQHQLHLKITNPFLYVFGNVLAQGGHFTVNRLPIRLIAGAWSLAAFVFVQAYTSTLITYIVAPTNYPLISSFNELADRPDIHLILKKYGTVEQILTESDGSSKLLDKLKARENVTHCFLLSECFNLVKHGTKNVYIDSNLFLRDAIKQRFDETKKCQIEIVDYGLLNSIWCFALQKHSPFTSTISKGLTELRENGLFNFWDSWFRPIPPQCSANVKGLAEKETQKNRPLRRLSLNNLTDAFVVLLAGIGLSLIAFTCERFSLCFRI